MKGKKILVTEIINKERSISQKELIQALAALYWEKGNLIRQKEEGGRKHG